MMRFWKWFGFSTLMATLAVYYAWRTREQFYWTAVFLTSNKISIVILSNMVLSLTVLTARALKTIFLGQLRDIEREILIENIQYAITETCLALTIFREEISGQVLVLFAVSLFFKAFHWLAQSRIEHVEQTDDFVVTSHIRLSSMLTVLVLSDIRIANWCIAEQLKQSPSVLILFSFEFIILSLSSVCILIKYVIYQIDTNVMQGPWHAKSSLIFFLELFSELLRFFFYMVFFGIIFTFYGMPIHVLRDLWMSYMSVKQKLQAYSRYRQLTANMNERFPDATEEEIETCQHTCIICRDTMSAGKKLPCSHIFHFQCLRQWLQQQQSCPTCRQNIPTRPATRRMQPRPIPFAPAVAPTMEAPRGNHRDENQPVTATDSGGTYGPTASMNRPVEDERHHLRRRVHGDLGTAEPVRRDFGTRLPNYNERNERAESEFRNIAADGWTLRAEEPGRTIFESAILPLRVTDLAVEVRERADASSPPKRILHRGTLLVASGMLKEDMVVRWYRVYDGWIEKMHPPRLELVSLDSSQLSVLQSNRELFEAETSD